MQIYYKLFVNNNDHDILLHDNENQSMLLLLFVSLTNQQVSKLASRPGLVTARE